MLTPKLVLSSTTTFFTGSMEAVFKKARQHGFRYLEILPYRWTTAAEILALEKKYGIQVAGIHLPLPWEKTFNPFNLAINTITAFYIGAGNLKPGFHIADALSARRPYLLFHSDLVWQDKKRFDEAKKTYNAVIENLSEKPAMPPRLWDPEQISETSPMIFDPAHYGVGRHDLLDKYRKIKPLGIHLAFDHGFPLYHDIPDARETGLVKQMLQIHTPEYLILECYPWTDIAKGKKIMDDLIA